MLRIICWKCKRFINPKERLERDEKTNKRWIVTYCPYEPCNVNLDLTEFDSKKWTGKTLINEIDPNPYYY